MITKPGITNHRRRGRRLTLSAFRNRGSKPKRRRHGNSNNYNNNTNNNSGFVAGGLNTFNSIKSLQKNTTHSMGQQQR